MFQEELTMIRDLILKNRSYRRFVQNEPISVEQLTNWVELARFSASGRNAQPLKYALTNDGPTSLKIFECLAWAGYLTDWKGPAEGERPAAYITMLHDMRIADKYFCDDGIAAQSILLGAVEAGFGGCIIASVNRKKLREILQLPGYFEIIQVLALGKPAETVVIDDAKDGNIRYWRDEHSIHHVPKRTLDELIVSVGGK
ncbi:MAG: nitroreductase family protein [Prolixibacteraceae bacterium]|jgi:nitroreductase|nr:nitroreductase family protein [Prolixibacteraceae bacterium]